jgi:hypothetical protein
MELEDADREAMLEAYYRAIREWEINLETSYLNHADAAKSISHSANELRELRIKVGELEYGI